MAIDWRLTSYGTRPEGPSIDYDDQGLPWKTQGGVRSGMAMRWNPLSGRQNTPVGIGSNIGPGGTPIPGSTPPPVWEGQENDRPFYDRGVDTSWDFDPFRPSSPSGGFGPGSGGMSPQPGENPFTAPLELGRDSPWGDPNVAGGNQDFYRQQLDRLNFQQQHRQADEIASAIRREAAQSVPRETFQADWSWTDLPEVRVAGQPNWQLNQGVGPNATNIDVIDRLVPSLSEGAQSFFGDMRGDLAADARGWAQAGSPDALIRSSNLAPGNQAYMNELANALYRNTTAPMGPGDTPAGYAAVR